MQYIHVIESLSMCGADLSSSVDLANGGATSKGAACDLLFHQHSTQHIRANGTGMAALLHVVRSPSPTIMLDLASYDIDCSDAMMAYTRIDPTQAVPALVLAHAGAGTVKGR